MQRRDIFSQFIGLGNNCEFGIVTSVASEGEADTGLFHAVGFLNIQQITNAISSGLDGMFEVGNYSYVKPENWPDIAIDCGLHGFRFHTGVAQDDPNAERELTKKVAAFRFRKRLFIEELSAGEKTFVYRSLEPYDEDKTDALFAAIALHGPGRLLRVCQDAAEKFAQTRTKHSRLYIASIARLSNENPPIIDFNAWERIATFVINSERAKGNFCALPEAPSILSTPDGPDETAVQSHRLDHGPRSYFVSLDAKPGARYEFTAHVWIPPEFLGENVSLAFMGWPSDYWEAANLMDRCVWQRLVVIARAPEQHNRMVPTLIGTVTNGATVYSSGWTVRQL